MRIISLDSCPAIRARLKQVRRLACGLVAMLALTSPIHAIELLYASMDDGNVVSFDVSSGIGATIAATKSTYASGFNLNQGLAFDTSGNLYVADQTADPSKYYIAKVAPGGTKSIFVTGFTGGLYGMKFDSSGNLYAAMINTSDGSIEKITPAGVPSTFATGGLLVGPYGLAFDSSGNLFVTDELTDSVNKITTTGTVSAFASTGMSTPLGMTIDTSNNLYVTNIGNNTISKITSGGTVTSSFISTGLSSPDDVTIDSSGNLYVANFGNATISKYNSSGTLLFSFSTGAAQARFLSFGTVPVPEPSTYAMGAIAACVMGVLARRRKARKSA